LKPPKILFFHASVPDYSSEPLFHGLRTLLGDAVLDLPRLDALYRDDDGTGAPHADWRLRGHGFTLYHVLPERPHLARRRYGWIYEVDEADLIVIAHPWFQGDLLRDLNQAGYGKKTVLVDGSDHTALYPYALRYWRRPWHWMNALYGNRYFKREWIDGAHCFGLNRLLPGPLGRLVPTPPRVVPFAFSIPEEKIVRVLPAAKTRRFPSHIVDPEVAAQVGGTTGYAFEREADYRRDLQNAKFGITMKRAGWDCLRHYELAANGCVPCFRDLHLKPATCAPYGLVDGENCLAYRSADELLARIEALDDDAYERLLDGTYRWIDAQTSVVRAREFLKVALPQFHEPFDI